MNSFGVRSIGGRLRAAGCGLRVGRFARAAGFATRDPPPATLTYSHIPSRPPSRPNPLSRYPPNPAAASNRFVEFTHTTPALIFGAMSRARLMFSVHKLAAKPYGVLFASATDSSGVRNVIVTRTGPKISTWAIVDDGCTFVNKVGG